DYEHLAEFLTDTAKRDRREVERRLAVLIAHLLKWEHQPDKRTRGWRLTVEQQRQELRRLLASGTLHNHAEAVLAECTRMASGRRLSRPGCPSQRSRRR